MLAILRTSPLALVMLGVAFPVLTLALAVILSPVNVTLPFVSNTAVSSPVVPTIFHVAALFTLRSLTLNFLAEVPSVAVPPKLTVATPVPMLSAVIVAGESEKLHSCVPRATLSALVIHFPPEDKKLTEEITAEPFSVEISALEF